MFGFGNSKQKKYKKALEEFLKKMMTVKDCFEIIQARGKGHAQMGVMLGIKVSDAYYCTKDKSLVQIQRLKANLFFPTNTSNITPPFYFIAYYP